MSGHDDFLILDTLEPTNAPTLSPTTPTPLTPVDSEHHSLVFPLLLVFSIFAFVIFKLYDKHTNAKPKPFQTTSAPLMLTEVNTASWDYDQNEDEIVLGTDPYE